MEDTNASTIVHFCGRHPYACVSALPQFPVLSRFCATLDNDSAATASSLYCIPSLSKRGDKLLVPTSYIYIAKGVTGPVHPWHRSRALSLHGVSERIEPRTSRRRWQNWDHCSGAFVYFLSNHIAHTTKGRHVQPASSYSKSTRV